MWSRFAFIIGVVSASRVSNAVLFPFEAVQLTQESVGNFSAIDFAANVTGNPGDNQPACKAFPGENDWPAIDEWDRLNTSLSGALLKPVPPASVCYNGPLFNATMCNFLLTGARATRFYSDDPLTVLTQWPEGNTCLASASPTGNCTQGGFPVYVVNATTAKHVQIAVNFARNKNIRLVIKNTGHDFLGRNTGAGAISVWTHYLKDFQLLSNYSAGGYTGMAAHSGAGIETWESHNLMAQYNITLITPLTLTVGAYGGFLGGGGHSTFGSYWGLGSDQVLSLNVVTADGNLVTADPETNKDLYWALRGGGASTFGIVTSAVVKARPTLNVTITSLRATSNNTEKFWQAMNAYYSFGKSIVDAGAMDRTTINAALNSTTTWTSQLEMPNKTVSEVNSFLSPLISSFAAIGVPLTIQPVSSGPYGTRQNGTGAAPSNIRIATRLFPRAVWNNETQFSVAMTAIRRVVEQGYSFRGLQLSPSEAVAGMPGRDSAVNPAWRSTVMHADIFDTVSMTSPANVVIQAHDRLNSYMNLIRDATPGSGSYINEADVQEPDWQNSFFGANYPRLLEIKKVTDPWNVFWTPVSVGSEGWAVRTADGLPTGNGMLCRV